MKVIGLTGGIASGKSTISKMVIEMGIPVIDGDKISREIVVKNSIVLKKIVKEFGEDVLNKDGTLNRKELSNIVFRDSALLKKLNLITHPAIKSIIKEKIEEYKKLEAKYCIIDAALLIESGFVDITNFIMLVYIDRSTQIKRLMDRDNISYEAAVRVIESQMNFNEKKKYADYIIDNNKDIEYTRLQLSNIIKEISCLEESDD